MVVVLGLAGWVLWGGNPWSQQGRPPQVVSALPPAASSDDLQHRLEAAHHALAQAEAALKAAAEVEDALADRDRGNDTEAVVAELWAVVDEPEAAPEIALNPSISQAQVVRLPALQTLEKRPGERVSVPLPDGRSLQVTVEAANRSTNGDYTWRGYVDGESNDLPVIFTIGANSVFATVTAWDGSYSMEAVAGKGWLYRNIADTGEDAVLAPSHDGQSHAH